MEIKQDYDLKQLNTFGISARAKFFVEVQNEEDLAHLFTLSEFKNNQKVFLGGGSNVLFTKDFNGIVVLNKLKGIEILEENKENVVIKAMSGEIWHDLVIFAVEYRLWGVENLSLIPGTVGAAPIQNIGAYGAELKDVLENVEAYSILNGEKKIFNKDDCGLGYRDSVFKNKLKGKYFILAVTLRLNKLAKPQINYRHLKEYFEQNRITPKSSKDVSDAVTFIRSTKLPDPKVISNAGSFFKNIFLSEEQMTKLLKDYPTLPYFEEGGVKKVPVAWLIEKLGWKGKRMGRVGVHEKHSLVLVNYGGATGEEIKSLADQISVSVYNEFGIQLVSEVNLI